VKIFHPKVSRKAHLVNASDPVSIEKAASELIEFLERSNLLPQSTSKRGTQK